jgi:deazaflavin-dependent oxidoreductase (nitroreductase family)
MGRAGTPMLVELTEFDRPHRLGSRTTSSMMQTSGALTFAADGEGTVMSWGWQVRPKGWMRVLGPLIGPLGSRMERRIWASLKRYLENTTARAAARQGQRAWLPPRWFVVLFWHVHRTLLRVTRGRVGLWRPKPGRWGALRLTTIGRRTGRPRQVVVGYVEDGPNLVTMAMNGWGAAEPSWWLNLQAHAGATAQTRDGPRRVRARRAQGAERERLWSRWAEIDKNLDAYAALRPAETAVVVLEPPDLTDPAAGSAGRATGSSEGGTP